MMKAMFTSTFDIGMKEFVSRFPDAIREAGETAGYAALDDAVNQEPTPPIDTGHLRGSGFVRVNGQVIKGDVPPGTVTPGKVEVEVGFNTPYAKYQHEGLPPGPGVKHPISGKPIQLAPGPKSANAGNVGGQFLSIKLNRNRDRYAKIFASRLARLFRSGS